MILKILKYLGFFLDYGHILTAHPPLRDRMLYGLKRIAETINKGVSVEETYFIHCYNFEQLLEQMYKGLIRNI